MKAPEFATKVIEKIGELGTVEDSLIAAFRGALEAAEVPQDKADEVMAAFEARKTELANALLAGTPSEPGTNGVESPQA